MNEPTDDDRALARKFQATWNKASVRYSCDDSGERRDWLALVALHKSLLPQPLPAGGVAYEVCCGKFETCNRGCIHRGRYLERTDAEAVRRYFASLGNQEWHDSRDGLKAPENVEIARLNALLDCHRAESRKKDAEIARLTAERGKYHAEAEAADRLTALERAVVEESEQYWASPNAVVYVDWRRATQALITARKPPAPPLTPTPGQVAFEA
jgi:hypothetical protein